MAFWIFMLAMNLLLPIAMLGFGWAFLKHPPKDINGMYGYRTSMACKSQETWDFAHHYFGKIWFAMGCVVLPLTIVAMLFVVNKDKDTISTVGGLVCSIQVVPMLIGIIPTEVALRKKFNRNGTRKVVEK